MAEYTFDLVKLIQSAVDQVHGSDEARLLEQFISHNSYGCDDDGNPIVGEQIVTVPYAVLAAAVGERVLVPRDRLMALLVACCQAEGYPDREAAEVAKGRLRGLTGE